jgi:hypothetical protein
MPNGDDPCALVSRVPDGEEMHSSLPPSTEPACHTASQETRALVDGVGVYTACPSSPFLTAPVASTAASVNPESAAIDDSPVIPANKVRDLTEPLRQQLQRFPLRRRLSEEEVSGLVSAVLDLIARHLHIACAPTRRNH